MDPLLLSSAFAFPVPLVLFFFFFFFLFLLFLEVSGRDGERGERAKQGNRARVNNEGITVGGGAARLSPAERLFCTSVRFSEIPSPEKSVSGSHSLSACVTCYKHDSSLPG